MTTSTRTSRTTAAARTAIAVKTTTRGAQEVEAAIVSALSYVRGMSHGDALSHPRQHDPATQTATTTTNNVLRATMGSIRAVEETEGGAEVAEDQAEEGTEVTEEGGVRRLLKNTTNPTRNIQQNKTTQKSTSQSLWVLRRPRPSNMAEFGKLHQQNAIPHVQR